MLVANRQFAGNTAALTPAAAGTGPTVADLFAATLWTGNNATQSIVTGIDMSLKSSVLIKSNSESNNWTWYDTLRGVTKYLITNNTSAEATSATTLTSFNSNGYSLGSNSLVNFAPRTFVGYSFKTAPKFFDVVTYAGNGSAGRLIPHGLGQVPGMVIVKIINTTASWHVWHNDLSPGNYMQLTTSGQSTSGAINIFGNGTATVNPTATDVTLGNNFGVNASGNTYVMYVFGHDVASDGVIQCGSYTGNGLSSGPTVTLGWEPQFLMIKSRATTQSWALMDQARGFGPSNDMTLYWELIFAEDTAFNFANPSSTGFQLVSNSSLVNQGSQVYLYMAIRKAGT